MKMHGFYHHSAFCHHPCCNRTVDSAGKKGKSLSVCTKRQSPKPRDFAFVDIGTVVTDIYVKQNIRIVYIHLEHLTADQHLGTDNPSDFRGLNREVLVCPLRLNLESLNSSFGNQVFHIFHGFFTDCVKFRRCLNRFAYRRNAEYLGDFLYDCGNVKFLVGSHKNQALTAPYINAFERFEIVSYSVNQHSLKIWFVHSFECNLAAPYD